MPQLGGVKKDNLEAFGSETVRLKRNPFTNLTREQVLPALVAIFGCLTLVFLIATIALAVRKPTTVIEYNQNSNTSSEPATVANLMFAVSKIENAVDGLTYYKMGRIVKNSDGHQVIAAFLNDMTTGITFEVNWEFANAYYSVNSTRVDQETFKIPTSEMVADLTVARAGNDVKDDVLLAIMADGAVKYMPIRSSLESYSFKLTGEISDVSDAVKFYLAYETVNGELTETVMVQQADGKIVDLRQRLLKIVGKDTK